MKNIKKVTFGLLVGAMAIGFSAFTNANSTKLPPGDFRFYNISGVSNTDPSNYRFRSSTTLCNSASTVCSEVWNIGASSTPSDGDLASDFAVHTKVGSPISGDYTGN